MASRIERQAVAKLGFCVAVFIGFCVVTVPNLYALGAFVIYEVVCSDAVFRGFHDLDDVLAARGAPPGFPAV